MPLWMNLQPSNRIVRSLHCSWLNLFYFQLFIVQRHSLAGSSHLMVSILPRSSLTYVISVRTLGFHCIRPQMGNGAFCVSEWLFENSSAMKSNLLPRLLLSKRDSMCFWNIEVIDILNRHSVHTKGLLSPFLLFINIVFFYIWYHTMRLVVFK